MVLLREVDVAVGRKSSRRVVIRRLSLEVGRGDRLGLVGPNGSGKSTVLKVLMGKVPVAAGQVEGLPSETDVGYMPQDYRKALFPWLTLSRHVELYESGGAMFSADRFAAVFTGMGLVLSANAVVGQLSGGEQQLLLLALVLALGRQHMLLDEPFSAVDLARRERARRILSDVTKDLEASLVLVSHDARDIAELTNETVVLAGAEQGKESSVQETVRRATEPTDWDSSYYTQLEGVLSAARR